MDTPSKSVEDFIKAVYALQQEQERVSTNALRDALKITAPSVTDMARRLEESGLLDYRKYRGVRLTDAGETMALKIIRRHRLIESYLVEELGYELHEVHEEADHLEHAVSDRFIEAIAIKLGNPAFDPHGDPIPAVDGTMQPRELRPLSELPLDTRARVSRLIAADAEMLQHTLDRGFTLETWVEVTARDPFEGPLTVRLQNGETVIGFSVAENILVEVG
jgi:DtxR family Mn-dependent transcriptional regulator